jgi:antitoxin Phd
MAQLKRKQHPKGAAATPPSRKPPQKWQLQMAKAQFSEVFRRARTEGPQHVTKQGKEEVVIISKEEFDKLNQPAPKVGGIWEFFRNSPLVGLDLDLEREDDYGREIDL